MKYTVCHIDDYDDLSIIVDLVDAESPDDAIEKAKQIKSDDDLIDPVVFKGHQSSLT